MSKSALHSIWVIGSINTDMVVKANSLPRPGQTIIGGEFFMNSGGKGANQAVAAARLGAEVSLLGCLGQDIFGDEAITQLKSEKINCSFVSRSENLPSGVALINVDSTGENQITVAPGANYSVGEQQVDLAFNSIEIGSLILLQLEIPLATVSHTIDLAQKHNCRVILDPAPAQSLSKQMLQDLYLITPNESEAEILTGIKIDSPESAESAAKHLLKMGVINVAITIGSKGVFLANSEGYEIIPAPAVTAIDTTAAGDCFNGSLAAALANGRSLRDSIVFACRAASIAVTRIGAQNSMPFQQDLAP
ncbi:MAG: ribokinase [Pseudohongiellaceae bacterium]|jgi:ribokinase